MKPQQLFKNILYKKDPLDLHPRVLNQDLSQHKDDQLQMKSSGAVKIKDRPIRLPRI